MLYAFTLEESEAGAWETAVVELGSSYLGTPASTTSGGSSASSSSGGSGPATVTPSNVTVEGTDDTGTVLTSATGRTIRSVGWTVYQAASGIIGVVVKAAGTLLGLGDVDAEDVTDGQGIAWDAASETFVPATHLALAAISPAQLTADTDDWDPTDLATADIIRVSTDASHNLTGIAAPTTAHLVLIENVGTEDLVLTHEDAASTAANRIICPGDADLTIGPDVAVAIAYDLASARWRVVGGTGGGGSSPLTTKGDIYVYGSSDDRLPVGTNDYVLTADSTQTLGVKWAASASGFSDPMTTRGDIIVRASGGTDRLALGTNGQVLTSDGTDVGWADASQIRLHRVYVGRERHCDDRVRRHNHRDCQRGRRRRCHRHADRVLFPLLCSGGIGRRVDGLLPVRWQQFDRPDRLPAQWRSGIRIRTNIYVPPPDSECRESYVLDPRQGVDRHGARGGRRRWLGE